jgi:hypothetical protein
MSSHPLNMSIESFDDYDWDTPTYKIEVTTTEAHNIYKQHSMQRINFWGILCALSGRRGVGE